MTDLPLERRRYELIDRVVELPPEAREAALAEADPSLAADVREMLAAAEARDEDYLEPAIGPAGLEAEPELPRTIGPYRLIEVLGEGGMGRVFLAEQSEPVKRRVALKILRFAAGGREARARFEAERHAMGRLDHPNVGKILEAGTTPDGLPFFAMELIDGTPITAYCDQRSLRLEDRLRLFADVCRGADHAHHKLLLHRDIKPSNVLVTEVDGRPVPKLIDFGIAKGLDASLAGATLATGDRLIGTPGYMSPEALGLGGDVDTRSDVFSLGVVFYELLTGHRPWPESDESPLAALKHRTDDPLVRPSTRVTTLDEDSKGAVAGFRGIEPAELPKRLRGDLDWIALKAIAHDPAERYGSAADLADDVECFLADEPVSAHAPTAGYLLHKLVRRHRVKVIAAAMVVAALVLGAVGTAVGLVRARAEAERASREADAARQARDRAVESQRASDQLAAFLVELFESTNPNDRETANLNARQLLQRGADALGTRLSDQPQARGVLLFTVGSIFANWGDHQTAESMLYQAVGVLDSPDLEPGDPLVRALRRLAYISTKLGHHQKAFELAERALAVQEDLGEAAQTHRTAKILVSGGSALRHMGRLEDAYAWIRRGLDLYRQEGMPVAETGVAYIALGGIAYMRKDWQGALDHNRTAIELFEQHRDDNLPRIGTSLNNVGISQLRLGRLSEAETTFTQSLELAEEARGPEAPGIPSILYWLGVVWGEQGDFARSEATLRRSLELRRRVRPATHRTIAATLDSLGWTIWRSDRARSHEAVGLLSESLDIFQQASEPMYPGHMDVLFHLGHIDLAENRPGLAESRYREACAFLEGFEEPHPGDLAVGYQGLGRSLMAMERVDEARAAFDQAVGFLEAAGDAEGLAEAMNELEELGLF